MTFRCVVGRHGLDGDVVGELELVAVHHSLTAAVHLGAALVHNELCRLGRQRAEGGLVEVVAVLVGDEEVVGLGHRGVVYGLVAKLRHGVNHDLAAVVVDADAGVDEGVELDRLAALGLEHIDFVSVGGHGLLCSFPRHDASLEVYASEAFGRQPIGGAGRAASAAAVDGDGLVGRQCGLCLLDEIVLTLVDVDGSGDVSLLKLAGRAHVEQHDVGLVNKLRERLDVSVLVILLAAGRA